MNETIPGSIRTAGRIGGALSQHPRRVRPLWNAVGWPKRSSCSVFSGSSSRKLAPRARKGSSTTRKAQEAWRAAGIAPVSLHDARHACITIWAQAIANPKRVQALAGHASIVMTLDRYGKHMNLGTDEAAAEVTRFLEKHGG
jgi:integrase